MVISNHLPFLQLVVNDDQAPHEICVFVIVLSDFVDGRLGWVDHVEILVLDVGGENLREKGEDADVELVLFSDDAHDLG